MLDFLYLRYLKSNCTWSDLQLILTILQEELISKHISAIIYKHKSISIQPEVSRPFVETTHNIMVVPIGKIEVLIVCSFPYSNFPSRSSPQEIITYINIFRNYK